MINPNPSILVITIVALFCFSCDSKETNTTSKPWKVQGFDPSPPRYMGEPLSNAGTSLLEESDGSINFIFRDGDWDTGGFSDELYSMVTTDEGRTWTEPNVIANTGKGSQAFSTISPISNEIITFFIRNDKNTKGNYRFVRSEDNRTNWDNNQPFDSLSFGGMGYGNCLWLDLPNGNKRVITGAHVGNQGARSYFSDDDGRTWTSSNPVKVPNLIPNIWHTGSVEPSFLELKDGRIWMLMRNSNDRLWESFSSDQGATWSEAQPTRFKSGPNAWVNLKRLSSGEILLVWNNAMSIHPSVTQDQWNFLNRDLIHAAISNDEGKTWYGFRELWLDPLRGSENFVNHPGDKGVNESKLAETTNGNILASAGQAPGHRAFVLLDPQWLYAQSAYDDFSDGLEHWSTHNILIRSSAYSRLYHYNFNRKAGAVLAKHPENSSKQVLHVRKIADTTVYSQRDGAVWNFPTSNNGTFSTRIMLNKGFSGAQIAFNDRWYQPIDSEGEASAMFSLNIPGSGIMNENLTLKKEIWHDLVIKWTGVDENNGTYEVSINGLLLAKTLPLKMTSENGISYVRFRSAAIRADNGGMFIEYVKAEIN